MTQSRPQPRRRALCALALAATSILGATPTAHAMTDHPASSVVDGSELGGAELGSTGG